jgi:aarF domain-containing kinase
MKNNFIHADCHGGNILVEVTKQSVSFASEVKSYLLEKYYLVSEYFMLKMMES